MFCSETSVVSDISEAPTSTVLIEKSIDIEEEPELRNPIVIGWDEDDSLYIASSVDTDECLWMIDIAKKIMETSPPDIITNE